MVTTLRVDILRDRVLSVVHRNAGNVVLASVVYERSASGEPTKITREDGTYVRLEYDSALAADEGIRIRCERRAAVAETSYGYDLDGNRTSKTTLTGNETYSYAAGFKLTGITSSAGNEVYAHDAGGRLTGVDSWRSAPDIEYDSMDRITRVVDGASRRRATPSTGWVVGSPSTTGLRKKFLTAPAMGGGYERPQAVTDGGGNMIASFVYAGEHPIAKITPSGVEYFLGDAMGSSRSGRRGSLVRATASIHL